jgi:hypothetical protein
LLVGAFSLRGSARPVVRASSATGSRPSLTEQIVTTHRTSSDSNVSDMNQRICVTRCRRPRLARENRSSFGQTAKRTTRTSTRHPCRGLLNNKAKIGAKVDDLLQSGTKQIVLAASRGWLMAVPPTANLAVEGITNRRNPESRNARK